MRVLAALTLAALRRLLREPRVARSLAWPVYFAPVVMGLTLIAVAMFNAPLRSVSVPRDLEPSVEALLTENGWTLIPVDDPGAAVRDEGALLATDGARVWTRTHEAATLGLESLLRTHRGAAWRMENLRRLPPPEELRDNADLLLRSIDLLFVLYALAFGLGSIARDRDQQILDVELTLPIQAWIPAAARWLAATISLSVAAGLTVLLFQVFLPCNQPLDSALRAMGAIAASAAVGVAVVGGAGLKNGFAGPFALGSFLVAGAFAVGPLIPQGRYLPIASIISDGPGWTSLLIGLALGPLASALFQLRVARAS